ncbi:MAG: hypothetical protein RL308_2311 [Bacteroidota bacterium]|jgi:hypothetical protein
MIDGFKKKYKIAIIVFSLVTIGSAFLVISYKGLESIVSVFIGGIAIITSVLALALADRNANILKANLDIWKIRYSHTISDGDQKVYDFAFEIKNFGQETLSDFTVTFRLPEKNYHTPRQDKQNNTFFHFGESIVIQNDMLKYLGTSKEDNFVRFEHQIKNIENWSKGNFVISISANGYKSKTYILRPKDNEQLLNSSNNERIMFKYKSKKISLD